MDFTNPVVAGTILPGVLSGIPNCMHLCNNSSSSSDSSSDFKASVGFTSSYLDKMFSYYFNVECYILWGKQINQAIAY